MFQTTNQFVCFSHFFSTCQASSAPSTPCVRPSLKAALSSHTAAIAAASNARTAAAPVAGHRLQWQICS